MTQKLRKSFKHRNERARVRAERSESEARVFNRPNGRP